MVAKRTLVSWIGTADLTCLAANLDDERRDELLAALPRRPGAAAPPPGATGPIKTLLESREFDDVHLVNSLSVPNWTLEAFREHLRVDGDVRDAGSLNPTNYEQVFPVCESVLAEAITAAGESGCDLAIHLSSGSPAIAAMWILLGKSRYPATFYQTHGGNAWQEEIPFDIRMEFVPELVRGSDAAFQRYVSTDPHMREAFQDITGSNAALADAKARAYRIAIRNVPAMLLGESGTGKEVFARAIHAASPRRKAAFVPVNCAAIPRELLESELFGHEEGSFTGATARRQGAFAMADGGTLFLDEIGDMDPELQAKLLRALQPQKDSETGEFYNSIRPVGAERDVRVSVRVVSATNHDLLADVGNGAFREDLYYRLAGFTLRIPSLRERRDDVPELARTLLEDINAMFRLDEHGYQDRVLSTEAEAALTRQEWPGNVRQLQAVLLQAAALCDGPVLGEEDIDGALSESHVVRDGRVLDRPMDDGFSLQELLDDVERTYIQRALRETDGVKAQAARLLGFPNATTLTNHMNRLGIAAERSGRSTE